MKSIRNSWRFYEKLGIPLNERKALLGVQEENQTPVAVDAVFDSVSVVTTFRKAAGREGCHLLLIWRSGSGTSGAG